MNVYDGKGYQQNENEGVVNNADTINYYENFTLKLQGVVASESPVSSKITPQQLNLLVQEIRKKIEPSIEERCGNLRVLDMTHPIGINDIYTSVNILEKVTGRRRLGITELWQGRSLENFERFGLASVQEKQVPGLESVERFSKLMILGKPGAGKTTFLKYLAIQCIRGEFQANLLPIFVILKDFAQAAAKPSLLKYIGRQIFGWSLGEAESIASLEKVIKYGKALILLDGLDEVQEENSSYVLEEIRKFSEEFHNNRFVITCRIAAREYNFESFVEVEVADFDGQQIADFSTKWFKIKDPGKAHKFLQKLLQNKPIRELATNPLLLTLLCLVFEESANFPSNRSELYKEGLDVLLKKWDVKRNIEREQIYKKLSLKRKEDLLSHIASITFEQGDYFFKQEVIEQYIMDYIRNLPDANPNPEELELDSEAILRSIEAQHGLLVERARSIYSFSHLTFQEYFTAKKIAAGLDPQALDQTLQCLVNHITEKRWREVFLLTVNMLPSVDYLLRLMKHKIDTLIASDEELQKYLTWVYQKSLSVKAPYKPLSIRAFYLDFVYSRPIACALDPDFAQALELDFTQGLDLDLALDFNLIRALDLMQVGILDHPARARALDLAFNRAIDSSRDLAIAHDFNIVVNYTLRQLKNKLPDPESDWKIRKEWWQTNTEDCIEQLNALMVNYCNIGHNWQFDGNRKKLLQQYYYANQLLVDCLNSDCYVTRTVREEIEKTLFLPKAE